MQNTDSVPFQDFVAAISLRENERGAHIGTQQAEMNVRYGGDVEPGAKLIAADVTVFLVARDAAGRALGCGGLRRLDAETAELKRMYVVPGARGRGLGGRIVAALEAEARRLGCHELRLESGDRQPDAHALYTLRLRADPVLGSLRAGPPRRATGAALGPAPDAG